MRSKAIGGRRVRLSELPLQPSATALGCMGEPCNSEVHLDCSQDTIRVSEANSDHPCNIIPDSLDGSDDDLRWYDLDPNTNDGKDYCFNMDWTEKKVCIRCDKGGNVLVCSDSSCPLAVHGECLNCPAWFDSTGKFYCPYCSYKRATLETHKAREKAMLAKKALSIFLDKGIVDADHQKQKAQRVERNKIHSSRAEIDKAHKNTRNALNGNDIGNHSVQIEKDQREVRANPECTTSTIPCKGGEEEVDHQFEIVQVRKRVLQEHPRILDDHQHERMVQIEQQAGPSTAFPVGEDLHDVLPISTGKLDNAEIFQEQEEGTTISASEGDCMEQGHANASDLFHGDSEKNQNVVHPQILHCPKRSSRKLSPESNINVEHKEGKSAVRRSSQRLENLKFPNVRRKRLPWTAEEEEMLKEGVQKFSTGVKKNLPWRKILEFGRHVFDGTRSPSDLKDKWRNNLVRK